MPTNVAEKSTKKIVIEESDPNNKPASKNYNLLYLVGFLVVIIGGYWLWSARQTAIHNAQVRAQARAFYQQHPFFANGKPVAAATDSEEDDIFDFGKLLPDFDAAKEAKLMQEYAQIMAAAKFQCSNARQAKKPKVACQAIAQFLNAAHAKIWEMHIIGRAAAHLAYCVELELLKACCSIEELRAYGLECACQGGSRKPHWPGFSAN